MLHARKDYNGIKDLNGRIPVDEPVFLLRAQDEVAVEVVRFWANKITGNQGPDPNFPKFQTQPPHFIVSVLICPRGFFSGYVDPSANHLSPR